MKKEVYFIGIGGIGMSALARYFLSEGYKVSGSDKSPSSITKGLKKEGIRIHMDQNYPKNIKKHLSFVVYNPAIPKDSPELQKTKKLNIPCKLYAEVLGELTKKYKTIAIAGSHGKSTTTAMTSLMLVNAGLDPTVIVGTKLKEFGDKNFRKGKSNLLVIEADEFNGSFWNYSPFISVVNNIDKEHLDFYKDFSDVKNSFVRFIKNTIPKGVILYNDSDIELKKLIKKKFRAGRPRAKKLQATIVPYSRNKKALSKLEKVLKVPGKHNLCNALAAYNVGKILKIPDKKILNLLGKYRGAWRRMEYRGNLKVRGSKLKVRVYDDYAHHPTEIVATLAAFRQKWPKSSLICVFQPHQASRLRMFFPGFKKALKDADKAIIFPTYKVVGRDIKIEPKYSAENLSKGIKGIYLENPKKDFRKILKKVLSSTPLSSKIILVMMGAGDIVDFSDKLIYS